MTRRLVSTPSSTKMAGHRSRTSTTKRARFTLASSHPESTEKNVGEETSTTSAGPAARQPSSTLLAMKLRWLRLLRITPSLRRGVQPGADDPVAVGHLPAEHGPPVHRRQHPGGMVGHPRQHRHVVAVGRPGRGERGQPRLRRACLWRKVVGNDENPHLRPPPVAGKARASTGRPRARRPRPGPLPPAMPCRPAAEHAEQAEQHGQRRRQYRDLRVRPPRVAPALVDMRAVRLEPPLAVPDPPLQRPGHVREIQRHRPGDGVGGHAEHHQADGQHRQGPADRVAADVAEEDPGTARRSRAGRRRRPRRAPGPRRRRIRPAATPRGTRTPPRRSGRAHRRCRSRRP